MPNVGYYSIDYSYVQEKPDNPKWQVKVTNKRDNTEAIAHYFFTREGAEKYVKEYLVPKLKSQLREEG